MDKEVWWLAIWFGGGSRPYVHFRFLFSGSSGRQRMRVIFSEPSLCLRNFRLSRIVWNWYSTGNVDYLWMIGWMKSTMGINEDWICTSPTFGWLTIPTTTNITDDNSIHDSQQMQKRETFIESSWCVRSRRCGTPSTATNFHGPLRANERNNILLCSCDGGSRLVPSPSNTNSLTSLPSEAK